MKSVRSNGGKNEGKEIKERKAEKGGRKRWAGREFLIYFVVGRSDITAAEHFNHAVGGFPQRKQDGLLILAFRSQRLISV